MIAFLLMLIMSPCDAKKGIICDRTGTWQVLRVGKKDQVLAIGKDGLYHWVTPKREKH